MTTDRMKKYEARRAELKNMSDEQLKAKFWELCNKMSAPLVELSQTHTSPSIERSVLMRMGIDSFTARGVVARVEEAGYMGKGAGHVVWKISQKLNLDTRAAAKRIVDDPECIKGLF